MKSIFTLILTLIILIPCQAQKVNLALNLEVGKEYEQYTDSKSTIIQDINGENFNMKISNRGTMIYLVKSINNNNYCMDVRYEHIAMSMQFAHTTVEFSSDKEDENDLFSKALKTMINKPFEITISKTGKIIDIKNIDLLLNSAIEGFSQIPEAQAEQLKSQLTKAYGADAYKGSIEMVTAIYPENSVNKSDKWNITTSLEAGMAIKLSTEYEFADFTTEYAVINGNSTINTEDKDAYVMTNGMPMKFDLTGSMSSNIKVDKKTGWIIEAKINQQLKGNAHLKESDQMPNGMIIPMELSNEIRITN